MSPIFQGAALSLLLLIPTVTSSSVTFYPGGNDTGVQVYSTASSSADVEAFYGIPFAQPPLGNLRMRAPEPPSYPSVINASTYTPTCLQFSAATYDSHLGPQSEDCLYLNVHRPTDYNGGSLPVMVYLYGGSFISGGAQATNPVPLIQSGINNSMPVIIVTPNYRLGPLGGGYGQEYLDKNATNLGLRDVLASLKWVEENIAAFGGDCDRITVAGQSAGAVAASLALLVPNPPKIAGVFLVSGAPSANPLAPTTEGFPKIYPMLVEYSGCANASDTFECLREADAIALVNATNKIRSTREFTLGFPWNPNVDYDLVPGRPAELIQQGRFRKVPIMAGADKDEGTIFVNTSTSTTAQVAEQVNWLEPVPLPQDIMTKLLELYPDDPAVGSPFDTGNATFGLGSQYKRIASLYGDLAFQHSRRYFLEQANANGYNQTWTWLFDRAPTTAAAQAQGVSHIQDNAYFLAQVTSASAGVGGQALSRYMSKYLLNFLYSGNPNGYSNQTYWPAYAEDCGVSMLRFTGDNSTFAASLMADDYREEQIKFINEHPVDFNA